MDDRDRHDRLQREARAAGFHYEAENLRQVSHTGLPSRPPLTFCGICVQKFFILLEEHESGPWAGATAAVLLTIICASVVCHMLESHPYVECTYSSMQPASCSTGEYVLHPPGDLTRAACEDTGANYTEAVPAEGMWDDCAKASTPQACEGTIGFLRFDPTDAAGYACRWTTTERNLTLGCQFDETKVPETQECRQWYSPFHYTYKWSPLLVPGDVPMAANFRYVFRAIEICAIGMFSVEYVFRMGCCTERPARDRRFWPYFFHPMNLIDLLAIAPTWYEILTGGRTTLIVLRILRLARVFRVLKAGRALQELDFFVKGYYKAREGLVLLGVLLWIYLGAFSCILYALEYPAQTAACFDDLKMCRAHEGKAVCATDLCWLDLQGEDEDGIEGQVVAYDRFMEGPDAPAPFTGANVDCNDCSFQAYNCTDDAQNATRFKLVVRELPWDDLTGEVKPICQSIVGDCNRTADGSCGGRISSVTCDQEHVLALGTWPPDANASETEMLPLKNGWYRGHHCATCGDLLGVDGRLGCFRRGFTSIPTVSYYMVQTMTTVGYGDHVPVSMSGKFFSGMCMLCGIVCVLGPSINVIGRAFQETLDEQDIYMEEKRARMDIMNLERFGTEEYFKRDPIAAKRIKAQLVALKKQHQLEDKEKKYDADQAVRLVVMYLNMLYKETGELRFRYALEHMSKAGGNILSQHIVRRGDKEHVSLFE